MNTNWY